MLADGFHLRACPNPLGGGCNRIEVIQAVSRRVPSGNGILDGTFGIFIGRQPNLPVRYRRKRTRLEDYTGGCVWKGRGTDPVQNNGRYRHLPFIRLSSGFSLYRVGHNPDIIIR